MSTSIKRSHAMVDLEEGEIEEGEITGGEVGTGGQAQDALEEGEVAEGETWDELFMKKRARHSSQLPNGTPVFDARWAMEVDIVLLADGSTTTRPATPEPDEEPPTPTTRPDTPELDEEPVTPSHHSLALTQTASIVASASLALAVSVNIAAPQSYQSAFSASQAVLPTITLPIPPPALPTAPHPHYYIDLPPFNRACTVYQVRPEYLPPILEIQNPAIRAQARTRADDGRGGNKALEGDGDAYLKYEIYNWLREIYPGFLENCILGRVRVASALQTNRTMWQVGRHYGLLARAVGCSAQTIANQSPSTSKWEADFFEAHLGALKREAEMEGPGGPKHDRLRQWVQDIFSPRCFPQLHRDVQAWLQHHHRHSAYHGPPLAPNTTSSSTVVFLAAKPRNRWLPQIGQGGLP